MTGLLTVPAPADSQPEEPSPAADPAGRRRHRRRSDRRRFTATVVVAMALTAVPYLWVLWDLWTRVTPIRIVPPSNFFDLQARAIFAGHLYLPHGSLGLEAFNHAGQQYTYFGLFPALLRMPVLALTHRFDGRLTAPSLLLAWVVAGMFASMLLWRVRVLIRGGAALGWSEALSYGVLMASVTGGSVLVYLAASPFVYNEDFAWSVALTTGTIFVLLGILEKPTWLRTVAACGLMICTNLDRSPTGYAVVIGALLVAGWLALGRGGEGTRWWAIPVTAAGVVALGVNCAVTWAKFGLPFGLPMADQVWARINAHRRYFLAANNGKAFSVAFIPSTALAYLQPFGLHVSSVFPYVTLPTTPARAVGGVVLDQTYPTASIPASMPLLFVLSCWGLITAFRRKAVPKVRMTALLMVAAGAGAAGVLVWGYIADRYMGDFLPFLIVAAVVGMVDIWRRADGRTRRVRTAILAVVTVLGVWSIGVNVAMAASPTSQWTIPQTKQFVEEQLSISPGALAGTVERGTSLPAQSPAGHLFVAGNCSGLYLSSGFNYQYSPGQQIENATWLPVEQAAGINHTVTFRFNQTTTAFAPVTLLTFGASSLVIEPDGRHTAFLDLVNPGDPSITWPGTTGSPIQVQLHRTYRVEVMTDPNLHAATVTWHDVRMIGHYLGGKGPAVVLATPPLLAGGAVPAVTVTDVTPPPPAMHLCRRLVLGR